MPVMPMLPAMVVAPALIVPVVEMLVVPVISAAPVIVPPLIVGEVKVLLVKVSVAASVTTVPDVGNTAVELTPVPPFASARTLVTAADCDRSIAPKLGAPPPLGTVKL